MPYPCCPKPGAGEFLGELGAWSFQATPASVSDARGKVVKILETERAQSTVEAEIVIHELAANAVMHAKTDFTVVLERWSGGIRITVQDWSTQLPQKQDPDVLADSGRGLIMIDTVSQTWGHHTTDSGKCVWADVQIQF